MTAADAEPWQILVPSLPGVGFPSLDFYNILEFRGIYHMSH